jgi:hypothetical protein
MYIPYQALRFPEVDVQDWSFNVTRDILRLNEQWTYNFIDVTKGNSAQYDAKLSGIENLQAPLRLNLFPYSSVQYAPNASNPFLFNVGMDLKYGLSDAFTLDATLVPDFAQVGFDEVELNLGPFEQVFDEQRQFFIEGTELFNIGDIFFSRRIGQSPIARGSVEDELLENEEITLNPANEQLLNAVKVTGRTEKKLGVGVLNAIVGRSEAEITDTLTNEVRMVETGPLTNYNMLVFDQQYGQNSSISFSNASTIRNGSYRDANTSSFVLNHFNKSNTYRFGAQFNISNKFFRVPETNEGVNTPDENLVDSTSTGTNFILQVHRISGKWRYGSRYFYVSDRYDPNDLGLNFETNVNNIFNYIEYNQFTPKGIFNRYTLFLGSRHIRANDPNIHLGTFAFLEHFWETKSRWFLGGFFGGGLRNYNLFESRIDNKVVRYNPNFFSNWWFNTDERKKLSINVRARYDSRFNDPENRYLLRIRPTMRFNDQLSLTVSGEWDTNKQRVSYVGLDETNEDPISVLSRRDTESFELWVRGTYNIDRTKAVALRLRNFWSRANFSEDLQMLIEDGFTTPYLGTESFIPDRDFNVWNMDVSYTWQFALASNVTILYRNSLSNNRETSEFNYTRSTFDLFEEQFDHLFSVRLTYFLDVNKYI